MMVAICYSSKRKLIQRHLEILSYVSEPVSEPHRCYANHILNERISSVPYSMLFGTKTTDEHTNYIHMYAYFQLYVEFTYIIL